ncbi:RNA endoribonuclease [Modicella reniformis]|uniref:RNA endoribonuclease n=1 Tax=Modicella reniformis TaxID=1440133 RepID=A0A9P6J412_9FUNG|nr:RNA endoribonuclease [Modicella reniformis]
MTTSTTTTTTTQQQQHQQRHQQKPQQQQRYGNQTHQHRQHQAHPQQQHQQCQQQYRRQEQENDQGTEAMDVDDETQLQSIATTITNFRRYNTSMDYTTVSSWASNSDAWSPSSDYIPDAIVVFDTNVLISHLNFMQRLVDAHGTEASKRPSLDKNGKQKPLILFIIPWVVVQELDRLKMQKQGRGEYDVVEKARRAIIYLEKELEKPSEQRRIRAQKTSEYIEKQKINDDKILDCCQYFRNLYADEMITTVTLFSNDRNLCVKAMIHDIKSLSHNKIPFEVQTVLEVILSARQIHETEDDMMVDSDVYMSSHSTASARNSTASARNSTASAKSSTTLAEHFNKTPSARGVSRSKKGYRTEVNDRVIQKIKATSRITAAPKGMDPKLFEFTNFIIKNLRGYFEFAVPDHMRAYYGDDWNYEMTHFKQEDAAYDSRCLVHPIQLLQKYWCPVFTDLYGSTTKARSHLNSLQTFVKNWNRVETFGLGKVYKKDLNVFLEDIDAVLQGLLTNPRKKSSAPAEALQLSKHNDLDDQYYNTSNRLRLMQDWRNYCMTLQD